MRHWIALFRNADNQYLNDSTSVCKQFLLTFCTTKNWPDRTLLSDGEKRNRSQTATFCPEKSKAIQRMKNIAVEIFFKSS